MDQLLILTPGSWKTIDKVVDQKTNVYVVDTNCNVSTTTIDHWNNLSDSTTYIAYNRVDDQTSYFAIGGEVLFQHTDDNRFYADSGQFVYTDSLKNRVYFADRPSFNNNNQSRSYDYNQIRFDIKRRHLNTSMIDGPIQIANQVLAQWLELFGSYRVKDWNEGLFLQALLAKSSRMSYIKNINGLTVIPYPKDRFDITDIEVSKTLTITKQPVDKDNKTLHVIANYKGKAFIM